MTIAAKLARLNLISTFVWLVLVFPSLLWWKNSILWVIVISLWANIVGHFSAYLAARSEVAQEKGYNLTELDKEWLEHTIISQLRASMTITNIAKRKSNHRF